MKFSDWPYKASFIALRALLKGGCDKLLEATLDRLKLRGFLPDKQQVTLADLMMPEGDKWVSDFACQTDVGSYQMSVLVVKDADGVQTFIGTREEILNRIGDFSAFHVVNIPPTQKG